MREPMHQVAASVGPRVRRPDAARPRIAIIVPEARGGWQPARMAALAGAITRGSRAAGHAAEVVIASLGMPCGAGDESLRRLPDSVWTREYQWRVLDAEESRRALAYAGLGAGPDRVHLVPDDGIRQFLDCDLWVVASPRLTAPLLPVRPAVLLLDDCLHHATGAVSGNALGDVADAVTAASGVIVTSGWMRREAADFYGADPARVTTIPRIWSPFERVRRNPAAPPSGSFVWCVDENGFGDLDAACRCLEHYLVRMGGRMVCRIVPLAPRASDGRPRLPERVAALLRDPDRIGDRVRCAAAADSDASLDHEIDGAAFVWHPAPADDGRLVAARASARGVGCLAADTPAIRELDNALGLGLSWMEGDDPIAMARSLAAAEVGVSRDAAGGFAASHAALAASWDEKVWAALGVHL